MTGMLDPEQLEPLYEIVKEHGPELVEGGLELLEKVPEVVHDVFYPIDTYHKYFDGPTAEAPVIDMTAEPEETSMHSEYSAHEEMPGAAGE